MSARLREAVPWWAKIGAKMALARLPVGRARWRALGLFRAGAMMDPDYALAVFDRHYRAWGAPRAGFTFLELGPGDSLASAVIGRARGAAGCWLVDSDDFFSRELGVYRRLLDRLAALCPGEAVAAMAAARSMDELLSAARARFHGDGLAGLRKVPAANCDAAFSQAVLEHLPLERFDDTLAELYRVLKPGGVATHQIDYRDHLGNSLNHLRFSAARWEAPGFARRSGFYTNRLRPSEMHAAFARAGFACEVLEQARWLRLPLSRRFLDPAFRDADDDDLLVQSQFVRLRKGGR